MSDDLNIRFRKSNKTVTLGGSDQIKRRSNTVPMRAHRGAGASVQCT